MPSQLDEAVSRQAANAANKAFAPSNSVPQYNARQYRANYRENMMQASSQDAEMRRNTHSQQQYVTSQKQQSPAATYQMNGAERFDQMNARKELYGDSCFAANCFGNGEAYADAPTSCSNPCAGGARNIVTTSKTTNTMNAQQGRLPCRAQHHSICQRSISPLEKREFNSAGSLAYQSKVDETLRRQHPLINGDVQTPGLTINAVQAEKESYAESHKEGNEEAYAHVEALKNSVRGYVDTAEKTLQALKVQNRREAARFGGICTASAF